MQLSSVWRGTYIHSRLPSYNCPSISCYSYLELLGLFSKLISVKREEVSAARKRTKTGLDKLLSTGEQVAVLQAELEKMQPELEKAQVGVVWVGVHVHMHL